jgi:hypothetical protein
LPLPIGGNDIGRHEGQTRLRLLTRRRPGELAHQP